MSRAFRQRGDRPCWSLHDASTPLASSSGATAAFTLRRDSSKPPSSQLVTAEFFNDEPAAEASYWQELHIHDYLTRSFTLDDRKLYMRQRTSASTATPGLPLAEELCQLRAFERRRSKDESAYHLLCYESYDGTLEVAVDRFSSSSASSASSASSRRSALRTSLFWCGDADGRADAHAMRSQSSAFIVHCLRCLQAHHQQQVLLGGNIQPAQLFFTNEQPAKPVFADYSHATALKLSQVNPHVQGHCSSRVQQPLIPLSTQWHEPLDSIQRRSTQSQPQYLVRRPTLATESPLTFGSVVAQLKTCLKRDVVLASLVLPPPLDSDALQRATGRDSNSSRYRAPEAESSGERSGFCCEASDVYSMCATLIDVLCGHDRDPSGAPSVDEDSAFRDCSFSQGESDEQAWTHDEWLNRGAPAIIDGNVVHFFHEAMKSVSVHWELSELVDQVQSSDLTRIREQLRFAAAAAAKAPPLYATCRQLRVSQQKDVIQSRHGLTFSVSPRSTVVEEQQQPSRPTLIAKRFPLPLSATHRYQSSIADHLQANMAPDDHRRFVRQRLRPDERLERAIAADLYTRPSSGKQQHPLQTDARRREHAFGLSRKEVMFFRYYSGSLADAIATTASSEHLALQLRVDWFWQTKQGSSESPLALQGDAEAMQHKALRFVLHCLQGLAAHHQCGVLMGDIKPTNLFYDHPLSDEQQGAAAASSSSSSNNSSFDRECRPRWGDYDHAANMHSAEWGSHVRIISQEAGRFGGYGAGKLQRQWTNQAAETGELVGVLTQSIGTRPYQAPEIFTSPAPSIVVLTGQYHSRSDAYALALTLLEVCVGRPFVATPSTRLVGLHQEIQPSHVQPLLSFSRAATQNPSCSQLRKSSWIQAPFALLPEEIIELLQQLLLPELHERPTVANVITVVEACLPGVSELPPLLPL